MTKISSMKEWIEIQQLTSTKDSRGNPEKTWKKYYRCRGSVKDPKSSEVYSRHEYSSQSSGYEGSEYYGARQTLLEIKTTFTMRYSKMLRNIDTKLFRCIWNDRIYNILKVDNTTYKNEKTIIIAICKDGNDSISENIENGSDDNGQ